MLYYIEKDVKLLIAQLIFLLSYKHCIASNCVITDVCVFIVFQKYHKIVF